MLKEENQDAETSVFICFPLVKETSDNCAKGCRKPGLGSPRHDPSNDKYSDCALLCSPCALVIDLLSLPFRGFSWYYGKKSTVTILPSSSTN